MIEAERGCGFRRPGGLYLVCGGAGVVCDRLPVPIVPCACCGFEPAQVRSYSFVPGRWLGDHRLPTIVNDALGEGPFYGPDASAVLAVRRCPDAYVDRIVGGHDPICVADDEPRILSWVGRRFYSPAEFVDEAERLGISKRIPEIPNGFVVGRTWILLAHPDACPDPLTWGLRWLFGDGEVLTAPGVFHAFVPTRIELILHESEATPERAAKEQARGVTIILIPDGAADARVSWRYGEARPEIPAATGDVPAATPADGGDL